MAAIKKPLLKVSYSETAVKHTACASTFVVHLQSKVFIPERAVSILDETGSFTLVWMVSPYDTVRTGGSCV